jgi:hypothetical protein
MKQLHELYARDPERAEKLWIANVTDKPFNVDAALKTSGRSLNINKWNETTLHNFYASLEEKAKPIEELKEDSKIKERLREVFVNIKKHLDQKIKAIEEGPGNKKEKTIKKNELLAQTRQDPSLQSGLAYLVKKYFTSEGMRDFIVQPDPDLILEIFENLHKNTSLLLAEYPEVPADLISHARDLIPNSKKLLADVELFPIKTYRAKSGEILPEGSGRVITYEFKPIPRFIHGIWKGIQTNECVGGGSVESLTPRRWAINSMTNNHLYVLESDGSYHGYIQMVKGNIVGRGDGEEGFSTDFMSPLLKKQIITKSEEGLLQKRTLYDLWLDLAPKYMGYYRPNFIVGSSSSLNNGGMIDYIHNSDQYLTGKPFTGTFVPEDNKTHSLHNGSKDTMYGTGPILEATVPGAGTLVSLLRFDPKILKEPNLAVELLLVKNKEFLKKRIKFLRDRTSPEFLSLALILALETKKEHFNDENTISVVLTELGKVPKSDLVVNMLKGYLDSRNSNVVLAAARAILMHEPSYKPAIEASLNKLKESALNVFLNQEDLKKSVESLRHLPVIDDSVATILKEYLNNKHTFFNGPLRFEILQTLMQHRPEGEDIRSLLFEELKNTTHSERFSFLLESLRKGSFTEAEKKILLNIIKGKNSNNAFLASVEYLKQGEIHPQAIKIVASKLNHQDSWINEKALEALLIVAEKHGGLVAPYNNLFVPLLARGNKEVSDKALGFLKRYLPTSQEAIKILYAIEPLPDAQELLNIVDPGRVRRPGVREGFCQSLWQKISKRVSSR